MKNIPDVFRYSLLLLLMLTALSPGCAQPRKARGNQAQPSATRPEPARLLLRCDDMGMCHAVNEATRQLIETGLPFSASVMFACPWYQEAVEILKNNPQVSVGIHLTLGAEWKNYRWGPVCGKDQVPSLVDSLGYFHATPAIHLAHNPDVREVEAEFRAQITRALNSGLRIDYLDNHMGAGLYTPEQRAVLEKLAGEFSLGISGYLGEENVRVFGSASPEAQPDSLVALTGKLRPGTVSLLVCHLGLETPEMNALEDLNASGTRQMSRQRQTELNALLNPAFRRALEQNNVRLITYRELMEEKGAHQQQRPQPRR